MKTYRILIAMVVIASHWYGFQDGMEWYRLLSVALGGALMGFLVKESRAATTYWRQKVSILMDIDGKQSVGFQEWI